MSYLRYPDVENMLSKLLKWHLYFIHIIQMAYARLPDDINTLSTFSTCKKSYPLYPDVLDTPSMISRCHKYLIQMAFTLYPPYPDTPSTLSRSVM